MNATNARQRMPRFSTVLFAQLELLVHMRFVPGLIGLMLFMLLMIYGILTPDDLPPWNGPAMQLFHPQLIAVGGMAGMLVWFNEAPRNRRYHWSLPVRREVHDVMRIIAGAIWLVMIISLFCVVAWFAEGAVNREQWLSHAGAYWAALYVWALLTYLILLVPCMTLGRPLLVVLAVVCGGMLLTLRAVAERFPLLGDLGIALLSERKPPSLGVALAGTEDLAPWQNPLDRQRVYLETRDEYFRKNPDGPLQRRLDRQMSGARAFQPVVTRGEWLGSVAIWYVLAVLAIAFAVGRRPDV